MTNYDTQPNREWWAQRWIDVLESFGWRRRLERARNYARQGNVLNVEYKGAKVSALVQGTAPEPYKVSLSLDPFSDEQWQYVIESLSERAIFSAKLLAGEMPQNIEEVFTANGLSLFPFNKFDIHSKCSCPDPANPCKHIGAVYYLLGDRFSEDPFVLFQLRGRSKEQIISTLRQLRSTSAEEAVSETPDPVLAAQPLSLHQFWQYDEQLEPSLVVITPPPSTETVLDLLGEPTDQTRDSSEFGDDSNGNGIFAIDLRPGQSASCRCRDDYRESRIAATAQILVGFGLPIQPSRFRVRRHGQAVRSAVGLAIEQKKECF